MLIPHQIQDWINELNNKKSNEMTRLTYLQRLEEVNNHIYKSISEYKNKKQRRGNRSLNKV